MASDLVMGAESPLAVTDTHALIWAAGGQYKRLGKAARRVFERVNDGHCSLYIPALVLVELEEACYRGIVSISDGSTFDSWARAAFASGKYHEADLTAEIVYAAQRLHSIPERGDRLIAATAVVLDRPLITRDPEVQRAAGVECIWS